MKTEKILTMVTPIYFSGDFAKIEDIGLLYLKQKHEEPRKLLSMLYLLALLRQGKFLKIASIGVEYLAECRKKLIEATCHGSFLYKQMTLCDIIIKIMSSVDLESDKEIQKEKQITQELNDSIRKKYCIRMDTHWQTIEPYLLIEVEIASISILYHDNREIEKKWLQAAFQKNYGPACMVMPDAHQVLLKKRHSPERLKLVEAVRKSYYPAIEIFVARILNYYLSTLDCSSTFICTLEPFFYDYWAKDELPLAKYTLLDALNLLEEIKKINLKVEQLIIDIKKIGLEKQKEVKSHLNSLKWKTRPIFIKMPVAVETMDTITSMTPSPSATDFFSQFIPKRTLKWRDEEYLTSEHALSLLEKGTKEGCVLSKEVLAKLIILNLYPSVFDVDKLFNTLSILKTNILRWFHCPTMKTLLEKYAFDEAINLLIEVQKINSNVLDSILFITKSLAEYSKGLSAPFPYKNTLCFWEKQNVNSAPIIPVCSEQAVSNPQAFSHTMSYWKKRESSRIHVILLPSVGYTPIGSI